MIGRDGIGCELLRLAFIGSGVSHDEPANAAGQRARACPDLDVGDYMNGSRTCSRRFAVAILRRRRCLPGVSLKPFLNVVSTLFLRTATLPNFTLRRETGPL